jgi:hypothetical protein
MGLIWLLMVSLPFSSLGLKFGRNKFRLNVRRWKHCVFLSTVLVKGDLDLLENWLDYLFLNHDNDISRMPTPSNR